MARACICVSRYIKALIPESSVGEYLPYPTLPSRTKINAVTRLGESGGVGKESSVCVTKVSNRRPASPHALDCSVILREKSSCPVELKQWASGEMRKVCGHEADQTDFRPSPHDPSNRLSWHLKKQNQNQNQNQKKRKERKGKGKEKLPNGACSHSHVSERVKLGLTRY